MKYGAFCFNMKITGKRKEKLLSLGFSTEELKKKRLIKFSKVYKPSDHNELLNLGKEELFDQVKGVTIKTSRGLRKTMTEELVSDTYIEANLLREAAILKYSNLDARVITLDKLEANHKVYAFYLDNEVLKHKKFREANPNYEKGMPCVYVGMTGKSIESRFKEHTDPSNANYNKGSKWMKKFGLQSFSKAIAVEVLNHPNIERQNLTFGQALQNEKLYGEWLRTKRFGVWWG